MRCRTSRLLLPLAAAALLGCPPDRGNHPDATETGGFHETGVLNYRYFPQFDVYTVSMMLPMEDDFGCGSGSYYGFSDDDSTNLVVNFFRGGQTDWEGSYHPMYSPDCEIITTEDYPTSHCLNTVWGMDEEGTPFALAEDSLLEVDSFTEAEVRGQLRVTEDVSISFRATNCGEVESYYYYEDVGRRLERSRPSEAGSPMERPRDEASWRLRFK